MSAIVHILGYTSGVELDISTIKRNLLFVFAITDRDLKVHFDKNGTKSLDPQGKVIRKGSGHNNVYELSAFSTRGDVSTSRLWHERFGHLSLTSLKEMHKIGMIVDMPKVTDLPDVCKACIMGKSH